MNVLRITLRDDGDLETQKTFGIENVFQDFIITRGSYKNVLLAVEVPKSLLVYHVKDEDDINALTTGNNVKIGGIIQTVSGRNLKTKSYELQKIKDFSRNGIEYCLYQRILPKEFTLWDVKPAEVGRDGKIDLTINIVNWIADENVTIEEVNTSPCFPMYIQPGEYVADEEELPSPSDFEILYSQVQDLNKNFNALDAESIPIDNILDMKATNVQSALEELSKRTDSQQVDTVDGIEEGLVDNTDPRNPKVLHDSTKANVEDLTAETTARQNADTTLQNNINAEKDLRISTDSDLLAQIDAEKNTRISADENLQTQIDSIAETKANKIDVTQEIAAAISSVVDSAPAAFDTLKEVADWIAEDETGTAALVERVSNIESKNASQDTSIQNLQNQMQGKVEKIKGKGLSTNDFTTTEKNKLADIQNGAEVNVQPDWEQTDTTADDYIKNKPTIPDGVVLYSETGENENGSMTQKAVTDSLLEITNNTTQIVKGDGSFMAGNAKSIAPSADSVAIGNNSIVDTSGGVAIGSSSYTAMGASIGNNSYSLNGGAAVGKEAKSKSAGGAVGRKSLATNGGSIGFNATTSNGFAGGYNAKTINNNEAIDAIQLGTGTNSKEKSLQVYGDNIYNSTTHELTIQKILLNGGSITYDPDSDTFTI